MKLLATIFAVSIIGTVAFNWSNEPIPSGPCGNRNNCASCHRGSAPRTHTPEFIDEGHGVVALVERKQCYGCHEKENSCDVCHSKTQPTWHTEAFRHPALGPRQRDEHALVAANHQQSCSECHVRRFQDQCSSCHRPDEKDLLLKLHD
jgi:hypothetical protein